MQKKKKIMMHEENGHKFIIEFNHVFGSFEIYGHTHDDNLYLIDNEKLVRENVKSQLDRKEEHEKR